MELRQLAYFVAIAQSGTITAAAQKLHMSQPPLSLQLQKLEEELGCPLFERDTRHLRMTPAGELFYERAQGILQQCADLKREMADLQAGGRGLLRIGSVSSLNTPLLPRWVARFPASAAGADRTGFLPAAGTGSQSSHRSGFGAPPFLRPGIGNSSHLQ